MITLDHVTKRFDRYYGLRDVATEIPSGCVYGLVGSNGSGKSTLLRLIAGVYRPNKGTVTLDGAPIFETPGTKERMFYISDDQYTDRHSSIAKMAQWYTQVYPDYDKKLALQTAERFGLDAQAPFKSFSKGMLRQAHIILGMAARPAVLLCDETFDGLDPVKRRAVKQIFSELVLDHGTTVVIASHNLRELEDICDEIGLLHQGKLVFQRSLDDLESDIFKLQTAFEEVYHKKDFQALSPLTYERRGRMISMIVRGERDAIAREIEAMHPLYAEMLPLTLEEIFITEMEVLGYDIAEVL